MKILKKQFPTEAAMQVFAKIFADHLIPGLCIYLTGDLGVGKTTFVRAMLQGLGVVGRIKSPTYTLVEPYELGNKKIFHFDLYRLQHADELLNIGIHEYFSSDAICLIEWPEKGIPHLPSADIVCELNFLAEGREITMSARSRRGESVLVLDQ